jgi:hypothetical protein
MSDTNGTNGTAKGKGRKRKDQQTASEQLSTKPRLTLSQRLEQRFTLSDSSDSGTTKIDIAGYKGKLPGLRPQSVDASNGIASLIAAAGKVKVSAPKEELHNGLVKATPQRELTAETVLAMLEDCAAAASGTEEFETLAEDAETDAVPDRGGVDPSLDAPTA